MFGPDSKALRSRLRPACLFQPSASATKTCAAPITGMKPTRTDCWAWAGALANSAAAAASATAARERGGNMEDLGDFYCSLYRTREAVCRTRRAGIASDHERLKRSAILT